MLLRHNIDVTLGLINIGAILNDLKIFKKLLSLIKNIFSDSHFKGHYKKCGVNSFIYKSSVIIKIADDL